MQSTILGLYIGLVSNASSHVPQPQGRSLFYLWFHCQASLANTYHALFHSYGPLISTTIGLVIPNVLMYRDICQVTGVKRKVILKRTILISLLTLVMFIGVGAIQWILGFVFQPSGRFVELPLCSSCRCHGWRSLRSHESPYPSIG